MMVTDPATLDGGEFEYFAGTKSEAAERITMVNGYVSADPLRDDQSRTTDLVPVDDPDVLFTEWAAWRSRGRLARLIEELEFGVGPEGASAALNAAIGDVNKAVEEMTSEAPAEIHHYEKDVD